MWVPNFQNPQSSCKQRLIMELLAGLSIGDIATVHVLVPSIIISPTCRAVTWASDAPVRRVSVPVLLIYLP